MRVLLVENNLSNCLIARFILDRDGFEVRVASSGAEGLRLAALRRYDIVLLDIVMPDMDGIETLGKLKSQNIYSEESSRPFFFALTAYDSARETDDYLSAGFDGVIAKPLRPGDLRRAVRSCADDQAPKLNLRGWSRQQAESRPLLDWTIIKSGPGLADEKTRELILINYRSGLSKSLQMLSDSLQGRLDGSEEETGRFLEALHSLRSASLTIGMDRAPHLAAKLRDTPTERLIEGFAHLLYAVRDSLPILQDALRNPQSVAPREPGVIVQMRR